MDIVVISGKQGSGKSTTGNEIANLARKSGYKYIFQWKFADTLYELHDSILHRMETLTGIPRVKKDGVLLQLLGTEWGREVFGQDVWVDILSKRIDELSQLYPNECLTIIDDCRFENEFIAFPHAVRVRLEASEEIRRKRTDSWRENTTHPSEVSLDDFAKLGRFDIYLSTDTEEFAPQHCATVVMNAVRVKKTFRKPQTFLAQSTQP